MAGTVSLHITITWTINKTISLMIKYKVKKSSLQPPLQSGFISLFYVYIIADFSKTVNEIGLNRTYFMTKSAFCPVFPDIQNKSQDVDNFWNLPLQNCCFQRMMYLLTGCLNRSATPPRPAHTNGGSAPDRVRKLQASRCFPSWGWGRQPHTWWSCGRCKPHRYECHAR